MKTHITYNGVQIEGSMGRDSHGRLIFRSKDESDIAKDMKPFGDVEFVTVNRVDAENILAMLNEAILRLESGEREDNDIEVFGDKAISYERLIDYLDGLYYDHKDNSLEEE